MRPKVHDKTTLLKLLYGHSDKIYAFGVMRLSLFGSFMKNVKIHKKSDIDFMVNFAPHKITFRNLMDLGYFFEELTGRPVELLTRPVRTEELAFTS